MGCALHTRVAATGSEIPIGRLSQFGRPLCCFFTIATLGSHPPVPTMGRRSTDSAAQTKTKIKASSSSFFKALTPASSGTPKPPSMASKKLRAVESDEVDVDGPSEEPPNNREKTTVASTTTKKVFDDKLRPLSSKQDARPSKSKLVKSPSTAMKTGGSSDPKLTGKKQKAAAEPVEADSEESEEEWVGFSHVSGENSGEDEEEGESEEEADEEADDDSSEEELLHGLSSDDDDDQDSSDEEVEHPGIDISKLPTIAKDDKIVKQKLEKAKRKPVCITSVLFSWSNAFWFRS